MKSLQSFSKPCIGKQGANPIVDVAAVCRKAEPQPTYNAEACEASERSEASNPLSPPKHSLSTNRIKAVFLLITREHTVVYVHAIAQ